MQEHLERLRTQVADCQLVRDLSTGNAKREVFAQLAEHLKALADRIEKAMAKAGAGDTFLGSKTQEPFPQEDDM